MTDSGVSDEEELVESELEQSSAYYHQDSIRGHLFLFIETLTGTSFEMQVSPFETIISIKAKLQQLEGIPIAQQHLLYNNKELPNKLSLYECEVPDGSTLKLVLAMRGGPINTRKTLVQDDVTKDLEDAVEFSKEELLEQIPEGGHVTVLVFRDGDQINLYNVLERPDGSYSPLSDSWSGTSIKNLFADQDDIEVQQRIQENANTMKKMYEIKTKMERVSLRRQQIISQEREHTPQTMTTADSVVINLPPIQRRKSVGRDWDDWRNCAQNKSKLRDQLRLLPDKGHRQQMNNRTVVGGRSSSTLRQKKVDARLKPVSEGPRRPPPSKLISLDVSQLRKSTDEELSPPPFYLSPRRSKQRAVTGRNRTDNENNYLTQKNNKQVDNDLCTTKERVAPKAPPLFSDSNMRSESSYLRNNNSIECPEKENILNVRTTPPLRLVRAPVQSPNSLEHRNLSGVHSRRRRSSDNNHLEQLLSSRVVKMKDDDLPSLLGSPKDNYSSSSSSPRQVRPSFPTRPLSGRKRKRTPRPRCSLTECKKRINITNSYSCRCEKSFCAKHRHPEAHACTFDYKTEGRKILKAANPMITVPKLPKI